MEDFKKVMEALDNKDTQEELFSEEQAKVPTQPISEEEFKKQIHQAAINNHNKVIEDFAQGILHLRDYSGVKRFKSIKRAIKRGHVSLYGDIYPARPFNNKKRSRGSVTYNKRRLYEQFSHKNNRVC